MHRRATGALDPQSLRAHGIVQSFHFPILSVFLFVPFNFSFFIYFLSCAIDLLFQNSGGLVCICSEVDTVVSAPLFAIVFVLLCSLLFFFFHTRHEYANFGASSQTCNLEVLFIFFFFYVFDFAASDLLLK